MSYFDVWKKMMGAEDSTQAIVNNGKDLIRREFKSDPSYKSAILSKLDLTQEPIDIRIKNVDRTTTQKRILFIPDTSVDVGSYISYGNRTYLILEFQDENVLSPYANAKLCNQTINYKGLLSPIPCVCEDTAYNDKGEINLDYFSMVDGKIAIFVPANKDTNKIKQNMRFIFNNNPMMVFETISIKNVSTPNIYKIVMKKVEYFKEKDDLENNIANNDDILEEVIETPNPSDGYYISSSNSVFDIRQYGAITFTVMNNALIDEDLWNISVDYNGIDVSHVKIESITSNSIKIRNQKGLNTNKLKLNFTKGDINIIQEVGLVK